MEVSLATNHFSTIIEYVPTHFSINGPHMLRELEKVNDLLVHTVHLIRWIKLIELRSPNQCTAHAIIDFFRPEDTNMAIKNGLLMKGKWCTTQMATMQEVAQTLRTCVGLAQGTTTLETAQSPPQNSNVVLTARQLVMQHEVMSALISPTYQTIINPTHKMSTTDTSLYITTLSHGYMKVKQRKTGNTSHTMSTTDPIHSQTSYLLRGSSLWVTTNAQLVPHRPQTTSKPQLILQNRLN